MTTFNGNGFHFDLDGTSLGAYVRSVTLEGSVEEVDITAGSSATHMEKAAGLKNVSGSFTLVWDDALATTHVALLTPGLHTLTFGPEGNATGKLKHVQSILITSAPFTVDVAKPLVSWVVPFVGAAAPTTDLFAAGVWA